MTVYREIDCCHAQCRMTFGLAIGLYEQLQRNGQRFFCPMGHGQSFTVGPSEEQKLRQENERLRQERDRELNWRQQERDRAERSASAYRGQVTKIKKRVGKGVCPCCNRTFADLARHMAGQHPDFHEEEKIDG